eukprot:4100767-Amphidinium_carterae.1
MAIRQQFTELRIHFHDRRWCTHPSAHEDVQSLLNALVRSEVGINRCRTPATNTKHELRCIMSIER